MPKTRTRKSPARRRRAVTAGGNAFPASTDKKEVAAGDLNVLARFYWWADRNRVELAPPAVAMSLFTTSAVFFKSEQAALSLLAAGALTGVSWVAAGKRLDRDAEILYVRLVTVVASVWLIAASILGPLHPVAFWALALGTIGGAVPWYRHKLSRPTPVNPLTPVWAERWESIRDRLGLTGSRVIEVTGDDDFAEITVKLEGGQNYKDAKDLGENIASLWELPTKAIKVRDRRKINAGTVTVVYTRVSTIDSVVSWQDAAVLAPTTLSKPAPIAKRETGDWKTVDLRGHWMIVGMSRAGKSNELHTLLSLITGTYDPATEDDAEAVVFFIDLKGGAVGGRWIKCVDWLATTVEEAATMFEAIKAMMDARAQDAPVGEGDGDQLEFSAELPAVYIVFDECAEGIGVSPGGDETGLRTKLTGMAESVARRGAALGFYLVFSGQDGSLETYGTEKLRGNLMKRMCFRVSRQDNAQYVLDNYTAADVKGLDDGQFYYHERADDPVPLRGPFMTPDSNRTLPQEIAERNAARRPQLDAATAAGGGVAYATRHDRLPPKYRKLLQMGSSVPAQRQETQMPQQQPPATPAPDSAAARAAEIEAEAGLGTGAPPITPEDLQRARESAGFDLARDLQDTADTFCALLARAPISGIKAKDLHSTVGVGKQWMYDRLGVLRERELVEQVSNGYWRARPGVRAGDLREAIDDWTAERKELVPA
ncbi:hypothetical protein ACWENQ_44810 [Nonomuraea sp. NPDC004354]